MAALSRCERCGHDGCRLALVSNPRWRESKAAGKPPNWSLTLTGADAGKVEFTDQTPFYQRLAGRQGSA